MAGPRLPVTALATPVHTATERIGGVRFRGSLSLTNAPNQQLDLAAQTATQDRRELYERCIQARDDLLQVTNEYRKKVKQPLIDATTPHTWSELDEGVTATCRDLEKVAAQDSKKMTGLTGRVRQAFKPLCRHAGVGQTVISFVPGDAFGFSSVLCAGFKVIFSAMHHTALYRDEMLKALEELPSLLQDSSELCGYIILENAAISNAQETKAIAVRTEHIESQMMQSKIATLDVLEKIDTLLQSSVNAGEFLKVLPGLSEQLKQLEQPQQLCPAPHVPIDEFLRDFCYEEDMVYRDCDNILKMLSPSFRRQSTGNHFEEERVVAIQSNPRPRAWLVLNQLSMLLLNGRCNSSPSQAKSEVSLVSAKIASRLLELHINQQQEIRQDKDAPQFIPLLFFCGQHRDWRRDPNGNPDELAMSLLLQLVDRGRGIIPRQALEQFRERTVPEDIDSICASLQALISSLQGSRNNVFVVILIDGLKFFSQPLWREQQTRKVVSTLVSFFRAQDQEEASVRPATLKFLFTSPTRTVALEDLFDSDEILHIQRSLPGGLPDNDAKCQRLLEFEMEGSQKRP